MVCVHHPLRNGGEVDSKRVSDMTLITLYSLPPILSHYFRREKEVLNGCLVEMGIDKGSSTILPYVKKI